MDSRRWQRIRALFDQAVEQPPSEREAFLRDACAGDDSLLLDVRELLAADGSEMKTNTAGMAQLAPDLMNAFGEEADQIEADAWVGARLGAWRLLRKIGSGGMGAVYLAERADGAYVQEAAIKLVRSGWDTQELQQRFRMERQILAQLNHAHIARLLDGGVSDDGNPYLVLEYVAGRSITEHCDIQRLDLAQRLRLFLVICEAVEYAHQNLVVHRDLKPSNILVDDSGQVKLLDFGIAKLIEPGAVSLTASRLFTPQYAAPEQLRGEAVTTRVDVHALGLLLYELLSGRRPYDAGFSTPAAYEHAIRTLEPAPPSQVARTGGEPTESIANARRVHPSALRSRLRGDLDAIVLKALRKDPDQRYASVNELASDIQRHLRQEPVTARRGRFRYRTKRFLQRHALVSALATLALLLLIAGLTTTAWQAEQNRQQRDLARLEATKARAVSDFLIGVFRQANPYQTERRNPTATELLNQALVTIDEQSDLGSELRSTMLTTMGRAYNGLGDSEQAVELLEQALNEALATGDPRTVIDTRIALGLAYNNASRYQDSLIQQSKAYSEFAESSLDDPLLGARIALSLGTALYNTGEYGRALEHMQASHAIFVEHGGLLSAESTGMLPRLTAALKNLGRAAESLPYTEPAYFAARDRADLPRTRRAMIVHAHQMVLNDLGRLEESEQLAREAVTLAEEIYGPEDPQNSSALVNLSVVLRDQGRLHESAEIMESALSLNRKLPPQHLWLANTLVNTGAIQQLAGNTERAYEVITEALEIFQAREATTSRTAIRALLFLALIKETRGELDAALDLVEHVLPYTRGERIYYAGAQASTPWVVQGRLLHRLGRLPEDCSPLPQALELPDQRLSAHAEALVLTAHCRHQQDDLQQARHLLLALDELGPVSELTPYATDLLAQLRLSIAPGGE